MGDSGPRRLPAISNGRLALWGVLLVLLALVSGGVYLALDRWVGAFVPDSATPEQARLDYNRRLVALLAILFAALLVIALFVVGAYILLRVGRAVSERRAGGESTPYVDAWSQYRVTDSEIEAATRELPPDDDAAAPPAPDEPRK